MKTPLTILVGTWRKNQTQITFPRLLLLETGILRAVCYDCYSPDSSQYNVRCHPDEASNGGGRRGEVSQQKEKEDSEKRY